MDATEKALEKFLTRVENGWNNEACDDPDVPVLCKLLRIYGHYQSALPRLSRFDLLNEIAAVIQNEESCVSQKFNAAKCIGNDCKNEPVFCTTCVEDISETARKMGEKSNGVSNNLVEKLALTVIKLYTCQTGEQEHIANSIECSRCHDVMRWIDWRDIMQKTDWYNLKQVSFYECDNCGDKDYITKPTECGECGISWPFKTN